MASTRGGVHLLENDDVRAPERILPEGGDGLRDAPPVFDVEADDAEHAVVGGSGRDVRRARVPRPVAVE
jgi:hypothetical protein